MQFKFYKCPNCGNVAMMAVDSGVVPHCCGKEMMLLLANTSDASEEKHLPVVQWLGEHKLSVEVGEKEHPMLDAHYIEFVCVITSKGIVLHKLCPGHSPLTCFRLRGTPLTVLSYCNVHGLWQSDIPPMPSEYARGKCKAK